MSVAVSPGLPDVRTIRLNAPLRWLGGAWMDLWRCPVPCLTYGLALSTFSIWLTSEIYRTDAAYWVFMVTCGFIFLAPMLAMGLYEAGRRLEAGQRPKLLQMVVVRQAFRQDQALLGGMLLIIFMFWMTVGQIAYGLSTFQSHKGMDELVRFALLTSEGHNMLMLGTVLGGAIAFLTFCLVVVSAPMLLDGGANVFIAVITSVRAVTRNFAPMMLWAVLIAILVLLAAASGFVGLIVIFPWLGLASWRAYREVVVS